MQKYIFFLKNYLMLRLFNFSIPAKNVTGNLYIRNKGKIICGKNIKINSSICANPVAGHITAIHVKKGATLHLGNNIGISNARIYVRSSVSIQDNVLIGAGCCIYDSDFHSLAYTDRIENGDCNIKSKPILIREGAFIGANTIILKGVTIGSKSIIGAGSVVTKNVPDNEVWAGNPAKHIKTAI